MWRVLLVGMALVLAAGCKKNVKAPPKGSAQGQQPAAGQPAPGNQPGVHPGTGVVVNPGLGGGGGGGAAQMIKKAVNRTVNENELRGIHLLINTNDQMPSLQELNASLPRDAPSTWKRVQDGSIVLTGTRSREHIWAYTADPQTVTGEHSVVTSSGVSRMPAQTLRQRLQQEQGK
jgi:hypothetical protein